MTYLEAKAVSPSGCFDVDKYKNFTSGSLVQTADISHRPRSPLVVTWPIG